ncbi:3-oxoacyl-[acyl-carrier-protein] reductase [bacterium]|nr:3-oxoacyl-[acyl-carrier-protein] reductase [bacterium]
MNLSGKIAIVTGGTRGIGFQVAETFAAHGANVVVCATQQAKCDLIAQQLAEKYKVETLGVQVNVGVQADVDAMVKATLDRFGRVDIMVNNAGITRDNLLLRMNAEEWDSVLRTNLDSVFYCTKAVYRPMLKQKYGRIINISSVVGVMGNQGQANYAASKAGMIGFAKSIAKELGAKGVTCNVVAPGFIETEMTESLPKDYLDNIMALVPLKRLGTSQEVADLVLFLASDMSSYITGQVIAIDGGMTM